MRCPRCGGWEHPEWIRRYTICQRCHEHRETVQRLFAASGLPARAWGFRFARLDRAKAHPAGLRAAGDWAYGPRGLMLWGDNGVGKTVLAMAMALRQILEFRRGLKWWNVPRLLLDIRAGIGRGGAKDVIDAALTTPLLFLDDFGAEHPTSWALETLFVVVDGRLQARLPIVITSNLDLAGIEASLGRRIADRIPEACDLIEMRGPSLRLRPEQHEPWEGE